MACKCCRPKYGEFEVCVTILEGKYLPQNGNPLVVVKVGHHKKKTRVCNRTDTPYYNEYFVFDFACDLETLLRKKITISVYMQNCLRHLKFHATIMFEVATVWDQPDHQYYHKWAMLVNPKDMASGPKGYIKCNITVNAKGQMFKSHPETDGEEDIEGNLLLPIEGVGNRRRARFVFSVYRADGLPGMDGFLRCQNHSENINPYIQISFSSSKGRTSTEHNSFAPQFNERIIFREMFPPLCHRVRIAIKDKGCSGCRKSVVAYHILNLKKISSFGEYAFLPTFGPTFVHFYGSGSTRECNCIGKCVATLPAHRGRVLLALKTEIDDPEAPSTPFVEIEPCIPVIERSFWETEEYLLVGIVFDVSMIDRGKYSGKKISFEISLGNAGNKMLSYSQCVESSGDGLLERVTAEKSPDFESTTVPTTTATMDRKYDYLPYAEKKPCMYVKSWWPNLEWRIFNRNGLASIARFLRKKLGSMEKLMIVQQSITYKYYNDMINELCHRCKRYLKMLDGCKLDEIGGTTKLDKHRFNVCHMAVEDILQAIKINGTLPDNNYVRIAMIHAHKYLRSLEDIMEDPQDALPDVYIWMITGSKRVAYTKLPAFLLTYQENEEFRGKYSGERISLFFKDPLDDTRAMDRSACSAEIFTWLGTTKHVNACWSMIPPGYEVDHDAELDAFPSTLEFTKSATFQLRAHIFQGRFDPGMDSSGLSDPLIRVIFNGHTLATRVIRETLAPLWDQTLIFKPIIVYGVREHIKMYPPKVIMEAFDEDLCGSLEFNGRCIATPVVKLNTETYSPPEFPPQLKWFLFHNQKGENGAALAAFELIETGEDDIADVPINESTDSRIYNLPDDIRPVMSSHRLEVIFWGVRALKKVHYITANNPIISVECNGHLVKSEIMRNCKSFSNFEESHMMIDIDLPEQDIYYPSLTIKAYDLRSFGCLTYLGVTIIPTIYGFIGQLVSEDEYFEKIIDNDESHLPLSNDFDPDPPETERLISYKQMTSKQGTSRFAAFVGGMKNIFKWKRKKHSKDDIVYGTDEDESYDWWSKYYASVQEERNAEMGQTAKYLYDKKPIATFKIYTTELEMVPEFESFEDRFTAFQLLKGKVTGNVVEDDKNKVGIFKGHIAIYRWPHPSGTACRTRIGNDAALGICDDYPSPEPLKVLVRIYVIRGINLHPRDPLTGKSDPYLRVQLGKTIFDEKKMYIANELNPIFGKVFEIDAMFPKDYLLTIQVWDYDATSSDDLIGETKIDIENRYYSRHRPHCGISRVYTVDGYNAWRDRESPIDILNYLCTKNNLPYPEFLETEVKIGCQRFPFTCKIEGNANLDSKECMALNVLHHWHEFPICGTTLVPEHVEQRPLFNSSMPGLEQGKLELWIDMFGVSDLPPRPAIDIKPKPPEDYELRVIVWNTEDIPLVDNQFLTGEKCSDIYVKGWLTYDDHQKTDVHYNSLTGEGNFNWRFVFRLTYLKAEQMMLVKKKLSVFAKDATAQRFPCRLNLQVWDNDHFSPDDFLGSLTIDLPKIPKGSTNSKNCTLKLMEPDAPTINLFKAMRIKAWWPFVRLENEKHVQAGKVEMELILVPIEEADENPVGLGRHPPEPMAPPNRPDTSFSWFRNPWKACRFIVCRYYKWKIIFALCMMLLTVLIGCGIYAFPGYFVKRILGA
ncbi:otoferlin [Neodiprion lecontei]|uniref:Otoferlin n=1 Tax=Neodiprion lecontei TaxID=441921 RepID=A0A6J0CED8_NEOLC|nr:otoferlin [Neodiprion lecontei]